MTAGNSGGQHRWIRPFVLADRALAALAAVFGAGFVAPVARYALFVSVFTAIYAVALVAEPEVAVAALVVGWVGVISVTRALKVAEDRRAAAAAGRAEGEADAVPDLRGLALLAALQVVLLFPLLFERAHAAWLLFDLPGRVGFVAWLIAAFAPVAQPVAAWLSDDHFPIDPASPLAWVLVLHANLTVIYLVAQAFVRRAEKRISVREAVQACRCDAELAPRAGVRVVAPLVEMLATDRSPRARHQALQALVKLAHAREAAHPGGDGVVADVAKALARHALKDSDPAVRRDAALAFHAGLAKHRPAFELERILDHEPDAQVRAALVQALARCQASGVVDRLLRSLANDPSPAVRREAADALGARGDDRCVEPLKKALRDKDADVRRAAATALAPYGASSPADDLFAQLRDPDVNVRRETVGSLANAEDPRAVEGLIEALEDEDPDVRGLAIDALASLGDLRAVRPLIRRLDDRARLESVYVYYGDDDSAQQDVYLMPKAAQALAYLGDPQAIEPLIGVLGETGRPGRHRVAEALGMFGDPEAVGALVTATGDPDPLLRAYAVRALPRFPGDEQALGRLAAILQDAQELSAVRTEAALALGEFGDPRALGVLQPVALGDPDWRCSVAAMESILALEPEQGPGWLEHVFQEGEPGRRLCAAVVLGRRAYQPALHPLVEALGHDNPDIRLDVARTLGYLGEPAAVPALQEAERHAAIALEQLNGVAPEEPEYRARLQTHLAIVEALAMLQPQEMEPQAYTDEQS